MRYLRNLFRINFITSTFNNFDGENLPLSHSIVAMAIFAVRSKEIWYADNLLQWMNCAKINRVQQFNVEFPFLNYSGWSDRARNYKHEKREKKGRGQTAAVAVAAEANWNIRWNRNARKKLCRWLRKLNELMIHTYEKNMRSMYKHRMQQNF